jgi:sensor histidine kinase YesM
MQASLAQKINAKIESWLFSPKYSLVRHLIFILVTASEFHVFSPSVVQYFVKYAGVSPTVSFTFLLSKATMAVLLSYFLLNYINPKYLYTGKYGNYLVSLLVFIIAFWLIYLGLFELFVPSYQNHVSEEQINFATLGQLFEPLIFIGAVTGYRFYKTLLLEKEKYAALEKAKFSSELVQLKNQVNPHFLFNTLNNLHVLIKTNPEHAAQIVLGLSDVLRYQTYDSASEKVLLIKDIAVIDEYIAIEKLRRDDFAFRIHKLGEMSGIMVPPLIFIVFVENALKHSVDLRKKSYVELFFSLAEGNLLFVIKNSKPDKQIINEKGGVGLVNVKKRLDLMYGEKHKLDIVEETDQFIVTLKIPL